MKLSINCRLKNLIPFLKNLLKTEKLFCQIVRFWALGVSIFALAFKKENIHLKN